MHTFIEGRHDTYLITFSNVANLRNNNFQYTTVTIIYSLPGKENYSLPRSVKFSTVPKTKFFLLK